MPRILLIILMAWTSVSAAPVFYDFQPTQRECEEATDFIRNAALSRNNGYTKQKIVGLFDDNVTVLSSMDPEKRWFVRSPGATRFLRDTLVIVFDAPGRPGEHAARFLESCLDHARGITPADL